MKEEYVFRLSRVGRGHIPAGKVNDHICAFMI